MANKLLTRLWIEPPVFFPVAVIFHFVLLVSGIVSGVDTASALWYAAGFVLAVFILLLRRWAAIGYVLLAACGLLLAHVLKIPDDYKRLGETLFPFDVIYTAVLLFFFKRFR